MACAIPSSAGTWRPKIVSPRATLYYLEVILAPATGEIKSANAPAESAIGRAKIMACCLRGFAGIVMPLDHAATLMTCTALGLRDSGLELNAG
jgi:hypothetical protein